MLPPEDRLGPVSRLIDEAGYFVVHAPRQCGKTTSFQALAARLTREGTYTALWMSCEMAQAAGDDENAGVLAVVQEIEEMARSLPEALRPASYQEFAHLGSLNLLRTYLARWAENSPRPLVLFFDEIDSLHGNTLISVLRQLRTGYSQQPRVFPHSVALIGLRDVRDYRIESGADGPRLGTASPFNIKVESLTLRNFTAEEVATLCRQHQEATGQSFTSAALDRIFELTQGQPWLVNALARQLVTVEVQNRTQTITEAQVELAKERLILRQGTHMDSLAARLREPRLRRVIDAMLEGGFFAAEVSPGDLQYAVDLGLLRWQDGNLVMGNPIYREVIPRALAEIVSREDGSTLAVVSAFPVCPSQEV